MSAVADAAAHPDAPDLLRGGALYRLMSRFGVDPEDAARAARRGALAAAILWVPMAVLAFLEGHALPGSVGIPLLLDVAAYLRPLVVIPVLIISEAIHSRTWRLAGERIRAGGLVPPERREAYDALVDRITRAVKRIVPEILCLALALFLAGKLVELVVSARRDAWYATTGADGETRLTWAGGWAAFVVHAALFYLTLRWLWLYSLWYRFLFGVARLGLHLYPTHPDRAGGLGLIGRAVPAAAPIVFAWSASLCANLANRMLFLGESLHTFAPVGITVGVIVLVIFVLPPIAIFLPLLVRTRRLALEKWGRRMAWGSEQAGAGVPAAGAPAGAASGGAVEPLNLEELAIGVDAVGAMRPLPLALDQALLPLAAAALPVVPLLFLAFPAREILDQLLKLVA